MFRDGFERLLPKPEWRCGVVRERGIIDREVAEIQCPQLFQFV
ncbi:MAG: hypothetical protein ACQESR_22265 [Planctomycetota bacterium]